MTDSPDPTTGHDPKQQDDLLDQLLAMRPVVFGEPVVEGDRITSQARHPMQSLGQQFWLNIEVSEPASRGVDNHQAALRDLRAGFMVMHVADQRTTEDADAEPATEDETEALTFRIGPLESSAPRESALVQFGIQQPHLADGDIDHWASVPAGTTHRGQILVTGGAATLISGGRSSLRAARSLSDAYRAKTLKVRGEAKPSSAYTFYGSFQNQG
ncbi:hypothetical protein KOI35_22435 [Actinoplanes bogorensis]|uniref:Uncharacterized protein n=1 Tax=Paractinoplanes bogorensis TaxID=1610840 RepID=A0ABS5YS37_9ACTN|nr:hypothetical protein [Actinoplanes bogorensis]MBU2666264.1 hypothetical protein [Actinoplanes bogorensis]